MMKNKEIPENTNASAPATAPRCPTCGFVPCRCPGGGGSGDENQEKSGSIDTRDNSFKSSEKPNNIDVAGSSVLASTTFTIDVEGNFVLASTTFTLFRKNPGSTQKLQPGAKAPGDQNLTGAAPTIAKDMPQASSIPSPFATPTYTLSKK